MRTTPRLSGRCALRAALGLPRCFGGLSCTYSAGCARDRGSATGARELTPVRQCFRGGARLTPLLGAPPLRPRTPAGPARAGPIGRRASPVGLQSGTETRSSGSSSTGSTPCPAQRGERLPGRPAPARPPPSTDGTRAGHPPAVVARAPQLRSGAQAASQAGCAASARPSPGATRSRSGPSSSSLLLLPIWISLGGALTNPALGSGAVGAARRMVSGSRRRRPGHLDREPLLLASRAAGRRAACPPMPSRRQPQAVTGRRGSASDACARGRWRHLLRSCRFPQHPLPGEGKWVPAGRLVDGMPAVYTTFMRPDAIHTTVVDGVAWMDTNLLSAGSTRGATSQAAGLTSTTRRCRSSAESTPRSRPSTAASA